MNARPPHIIQKWRVKSCWDEQCEKHTQPRKVYTHIRSCVRYCRVLRATRVLLNVAANSSRDSFILLRFQYTYTLDMQSSSKLVPDEWMTRRTHKKNFTRVPLSLGYTIPFKCCIHACSKPMMFIQHAHKQSHTIDDEEMEYDVPTLQHNHCGNGDGFSYMYDAMILLHSAFIVFFFINAARCAAPRRLTKKGHN